MFFSLRVAPFNLYDRESHQPTGNNIYFDISAHPTKPIALISSGGNEDILLARENHFTINRLHDVFYHTGVDWIPDTNKALVVGTKIGSNITGTVHQFLLSENKINFVSKFPVQLQSIDINQNGRALIVGGSLDPKKSIFLSFENNEFDQPKLFVNEPLHDVAWNPAGTEALLSGENGTLIKWTDGSFSSLPSQSSKLLKSIAYHPSENIALIGGEDGALKRFELGEVDSIQTPFQWSIMDIAWNPSTSKALLVGKSSSGETGYITIYENGEFSKQIDTQQSLISADWITRNHALVGGREELWHLYTSQFKRTVSNEFKPSLSLVNISRSPEISITVSGFGSTYRSSTKNISAYQFRDRADTSEWRQNPDFSASYQKPGTYKIDMRVRNQTGKVSEWTQKKITVNTGYESYMPTDIWSVSLLLALSIVLLLSSIIIVGRIRS